jgi:hypothetical protein
MLDRRDEGQPAMAGAGARDAEIDMDNIPF